MILSDAWLQKYKAMKARYPKHIGFLITDPTSDSYLCIDGSDIKRCVSCFNATIVSCMTSDGFQDAVEVHYPREYHDRTDDAPLFLCILLRAGHSAVFQWNLGGDNEAVASAHTNVPEELPNIPDDLASGLPLEDLAREFREVLDMILATKRAKKSTITRMKLRLARVERAMRQAATVKSEQARKAGAE